VIGEMCLSLMTGVYNKWKSDGIVKKEKRTATVVALDFNTTLINNKLNIVGKFAKVFVDVPANYIQNFGTEQMGAHLDIVYTLVQKKIFAWEKAKVNVVCRFDYADYNQNKFRETGGKIADELWEIVPMIVFRPTETTVFRFNYRYQEQMDLLGNPIERTGIIQFGFSSYF